MIDFHRPMRTSLASVLARLILHWPVEELSLRLVDLFVGATVEDNEIRLPAVRETEVLPRRWEGLGLTLPHRCSRLCHDLHHTLVLLVTQALKFLDLAVLMRADVRDAGKLIS